MKPKVFPSYRYRHNFPAGKLFKTESEWNEFGGVGQGWVAIPSQVQEPSEIKCPELVNTEVVRELKQPKRMR